MTEPIQLSAIDYFTSPLLSDQAEVAHFMVGEYARALMEIATERCAPVLRAQDAATSDALTQATAAAVPWRLMWTPELARLEQHMVRDAAPSEIWGVLAQHLLGLGAAGYLREADLRLASPVAMDWDTVRLPEADRIAFRHADSRVEIRLFRGRAQVRSVVLERSPKGTWITEDAPTCAVVSLGGHRIVVHPADDDRFALPSGRAGLTEDPARFSEVFVEAAALVHGCAPKYLPWVADAVRVLVLLDGSDGVKMSATVEELPGLVYLSLPAEASEVAARLVHEASHQYFFALRRLGRLHDGSDTRQYHSPIKNRNRPLETILFAFHAFGNGALFHRELARKEPRFGVIGGQTLDSILAQLRVLDGHLRQTSALTDFGKALWKPLSAALFD